MLLPAHTLARDALTLAGMSLDERQLCGKADRDSHFHLLVSWIMIFSRLIAGFFRVAFRDFPHDTGWDFRSGGLGAQELVLDISGTTYTVALDTDLTDPADAAAVLSEALDGIATVLMIEDGFTAGNIIIETVSVGAGSYIRVLESSSEKAKMMLTPPLEGMSGLTISLSSLSQFLVEGERTSPIFTAFPCVFNAFPR